MKTLIQAAVFAVIAALAIPLSAPLAMAQATYGSLTGAVNDSSGAVITGAAVTAKNVATGIESKTASNNEGQYTFAQLPPGTYLLTVEKQGFKKGEFQDVAILVGQTQSIDVTLQAGQVSETVTVTAGGAELLQKEQAQVSNTFESRKVVELPTNIAGGGIDTLALLAPGVVPGFGNVNSNGTTLSVNGNRARSNNFTIDGQDNNDLSIGGPAYFVGNNDAVSEFQIITNNFSAEYGRNLGAVVNVSTKSGTNSYRGSLAWFHRDRKALDALTNIERRGGRKDPPPFLYNVFNGTVGGPVIRDKIFFFGSFQEITQRASTLGQSGNPAIATEELGRLGSAFPNNPAIQAIVKYSAFANTGVGDLRERTDRSRTEFITINGVRYRVAYPERQVTNADNNPDITARGDWNITDKHRVWYRHLYQKQQNHFGTGTVSSGYLGDVPASSVNTGFNLTSQLSNTSVNEFRFVFSRLSVIFGGGCEGKFVGCIPDPANVGQAVTNISLTGIQSQRINATTGAVENTGVSLQGFGAATNLPQGRQVSTYQYTDNFSKSLGLHQLKFGVDLRHLTNSVPFLPFINGGYAFSTVTRLINNTPNTVQLALGQFTIAYKENDQFYYFQDDYRIKDNLTLNLGVRYEYTGQPVNTLYDITRKREADPATALFKQSLPIEARIVPKVPADKNNIAPRLGFAWRPRSSSGWMKKMLGEQDETVIRGGYAVAYDPGFYNILLNVSTASPGVFLNTTTNAETGTATFPLVGDATGASIAAFAQSAGLVVKNTFDPKFFSQTKVSGDFHAPYSQQWSLGIQRQIARNNVVEVRYIGNHGVSLFQTINRNPRIDRLINGFTLNVRTGFNANGTSITTPIAFPSFKNLVPTGLTPLVAGTAPCVNDPATTTLDESAQCNGRIQPASIVRSRENTAQSTYHGLQTQYQGRLWNQLSIGASFTYSKALDNASEIFAFAENAAGQNPFNIGDAEKGLSGQHRKYSSSFNFLYEFPFLKNQEGIIGRVLGGWQLNGIYYLASGRRFTPQQNFNRLNVAASYEDATWDSSFIGLDSLRPFAGNRDAPKNSVGISQIDATFLYPNVAAQDLNGFYSLNELNKGHVVVVTPKDVRLILNGPGAAKIFNTPFGNVARNSEAGPTLNDLNLGVFKNFRITERFKLQFRVDSYNALNHKNPGVGFNAGGDFPTNTIESAGSTDGYYDFGALAGARRAWQFGLKLLF
jgi:outer membrane receptor protein involved in Fe transport